MAAGVPFGRYTLVRRLARGGMAEIFLALQEGPEGFSRRLVIKRILPHLAADPSFLRMFMDEARIVAMLSHPHIVHLYDFGEVEGSYYLAMEYVDGIDLKQLGDRVGPVPPAHAAKIMSYVCEGLNHAHELAVDGRSLGLVHRDVTPSNILVSYDGTVKVADFGIAKTYSGDDRTRAGVVKGKFAYLSPEQARGLPLDHRSDQFNIGILLYETLTGANLFPHDSFQRAMKAIIGGEIEPPDRMQPSVPARLSAIVMKALSGRRDDRYPDTLALRADLEAFLREWPEPSDAVALGQFVREAFPDRQSAQHTGALPQGTAPLRAGTAAAALHTRTAAASGQPLVPAELLEPTKRESPLSRTDDEEEPSGLGVAIVDDDVLVDDDSPPRVGLHDAATDLHGTVLPDVGEDGLVEEATRTNALAMPTRTSMAASAWDLGQQKRRRRTVVVTLAVALVAGLVTTAALLWTGGAPASDDPPSAPPAAPPPPLRPAHRALGTELRIASEPAGARILVDGAATQYLTPSQVAVEGQVAHRVGLALEGYDGFERVVPPSPGAVVEVYATLVQKAPPRVVAADAGVAEAGPIAVAPPEGPEDPRGPRHGPGHKGPHRGNPDRGARDAGPARPAGAVGYLSVDTMPWSKVYLGGRYLGQTPMGERQVPAGRHVLRLVNPERGLERSLSVTIEPDRVRRVSLSL